MDQQRAVLDCCVNLPAVHGQRNVRHEASLGIQPRCGCRLPPDTPADRCSCLAKCLKRPKHPRFHDNATGPESRILYFRSLGLARGHCQRSPPAATMIGGVGERLGHREEMGWSVRGRAMHAGFRRSPRANRTRMLLPSPSRLKPGRSARALRCCSSRAAWLMQRRLPTH